MTDTKNPTETAVVVQAPPERVFELAVDFAGAAERITGIKKVEMLTDGPVGVGSRFRETRLMFGREGTETMEVSAFEPPQRVELRAVNHGCVFVSEIGCEPHGDGETRLSMSFAVLPQSRFARLMTFLMKPMMKKVAKACAEDLNDLKRAAESEVVGS